MQDELDVDVDWRGFQLHPEIPPGGVAAAQLFGERRVRAYAARMIEFAREFGVDMALPERIPCTVPALAITEYARDQGKLVLFRDAVMDAHWLAGGDIEDGEQLGDIARDVGLDAGAARAASDDPVYVERVAAARREAFDRMVTAIPTFVFGQYPVVGCQRYETLERVARKVGLA